MRKYRRSKRGRDWSKRSDREYVRRAPHRLPPLHDVPGECRLCRQAVPPSRDGKPRAWHYRKGEPNCWQEYKLMTRHGLAKQALARTRGNACEQCHVKGKTRSAKWLHLDHIEPLIESANDEDRLRFFRLDNLQLLCEDCHKAKTSAENSQRAAQRKAAAAALENVAA